MTLGDVTNTVYDPYSGNMMISHQARDLFGYIFFYTTLSFCYRGGNRSGMVLTLTLPNISSGLHHHHPSGAWLKPKTISLGTGIGSKQRVALQLSSSSVTTAMTRICWTIPKPAAKSTGQTSFEPWRRGENCFPAARWRGNQRITRVFFPSRSDSKIATWAAEATNCDIFDVAPFSKRPSSGFWKNWLPRKIKDQTAWNNQIFWDVWFWHVLTQSLGCESFYSV